jgi:hypothetical protein
MQPEVLKIQIRIRELYEELLPLKHNDHLTPPLEAYKLEAQIEALRWVLHGCFDQTPWIVEHHDRLGSLPKPNTEKRK